MKNDCENVVTSDGGTSYCRLAEDSVKRLDAEIERLTKQNVEYSKECGKLMGENERLKDALSEKDKHMLHCHSKGGNCKCKDLEAELQAAQKEIVSMIANSRNNNCPCCHARLDEINGPCKWCKDAQHFRDEQEMHRAWRKRAEEAEADLAAEKEKVELLQASVKTLEALKINYHDGNGEKIKQLEAQLSEATAKLAEQDKHMLHCHQRGGDCRCKELEARVKELEQERDAEQRNFQAEVSLRKKIDEARSWLVKEKAKLEATLQTREGQVERMRDALEKIAKGQSCREEDGSYSVAPLSNSREVAQEALSSTPILPEKDGDCPLVGCYIKTPHDHQAFSQEPSLPWGELLEAARKAQILLDEGRWKGLAKVLAKFPRSGA